jgi:hypothetical protein
VYGGTSFPTIPSSSRVRMPYASGTCPSGERVVGVGRRDRLQECGVPADVGEHERAARRCRGAGGRHGTACTTRTADPCSSPLRRRSSARFPSSSGKVSTAARTGTLGAMARNSSPSERVRFATGPDRALAPEELVRERRDVGHVDSRTHDRAALADVAQRRGNELSDRREHDHGVELVGRPCERVPGPDRAEGARERLPLLVACPCPCIDPATLCHRDLADDVRRCPEAVQPDPLRIAGEPQRAVADEAGTEERCGLLVPVALGNREAEPLVGDRQLCVAPVEVVPGEPRPITEVLRLPRGRNGTRRRPSRATGRRRDRPARGGSPPSTTSPTT